MAEKREKSVFLDSCQASGIPKHSWKKKGLNCVMLVEGKEYSDNRSFLKENYVHLMTNGRTPSADDTRFVFRQETPAKRKKEKAKSF